MCRIERPSAHRLSELWDASAAAPSAEEGRCRANFDKGQDRSLSPPNHMPVPCDCRSTGHGVRELNSLPSSPSARDEKPSRLTSAPECRKT